MNFQQLRIIRETVKRNYNLTEVANALFTSQSGVSKHIKDLEDELGIELFVRKGKRFLGLTEPGQELVAIVERMLLDAKNIKQLAEQFSNSEVGELHIATTHTQARYVLPPVVAKFKLLFPKVHLVLHQAYPTEIAGMLLDGQVDIGIATEALNDIPNLVHFPFYSWTHSVIIPIGHPLEQIPYPSLEDIAAYPIITYYSGMTGRAKIDAAFAAAGVSPDIVLSALDSDVVKTYVELGLGIGIVASVAFNSQRDSNLRMLDCTRIFEANTTHIAVRHGNYLRGYAFQFMELCSANLTEASVRKALAAGADEV
jgi:LysR family cys regulon transcriptional activator